METRKAQRSRHPSRRGKAQPAAGDSPETTPPPPRLPARRNPKWIALGVVALCLGGLLSYVIYARLANETAVVTVAQTVYRGEVIDVADLSTITLQGNSIAQAVPAVDLDAVVGLKLSAGRTPTSLLIPSAAVRLVALPSQNGSDDLTGDTFTARIVDQANGPDGTSILVNVDVAADQAATIAQLAAQDRIALVRDAGR